MNKFEVGDTAYYWYLGYDSSFLHDIDILELHIENELQAQTYSDESTVYLSKEDAMKAIYDRLAEIS